MPNYSSLRRSLVHYWSMDNGAYPYTQWDRMGTCHLSTWTILPTGGMKVTGKIGYAANLVKAPFGAFKTTIALFATTPTRVTISSWFRMDDPTADPIIVGSLFGSPPTGGWSLQYLYGTSNFRFSFTCVAPLPLPGPTVNVYGPHTAAAGEWVHVLSFIDIPNRKIGIRVNGGDVIWQVSADITQYATGYYFRIGPLFEGAMDDTAIWSRLLTTHEQDALWNDGDGLGFDSFKLVTEETGCQEIPCCEDDPYTYQASTATDSGASTGSDCAEVPTVTIEPPESSSIVFPTFIILSASMTGSVIRYTTDGTEPDEDSTVYSIPFEIFGPGIVRAKAWLGECAGPTAAASYSRFETFDFVFYNICTPPAITVKAGKWGEFGPVFSLPTNYGWQLEFTNAAPLHLVALEIYETNAVGVWNTGQAWATREFIDPPNSAPDFGVYPLVLEEGAVINTAYSDDFCTTYGDFAAAAHSITMYGAIQVDVPGVTYFRLRLFLQSGVIVERIIASNTCDPPPCDKYPPAPTLVVACGKITVSFTTDAGMDYQIWRLGTDTFESIMVDSGTTLLLGNSFEDTGVVPDVTYCYTLKVKYSPPCNQYTSSADVCTNIPALAALDVTQDVTLIDGSSGTVTFTVVSSNLSPGGTCADALVHYSYTDGSGLQSGTVPGNSTQTLPILFFRPAAAPYTVTVTFTACNLCNVKTVPLDVEFTPPPCCLVTPATVDVDVATFNAAVQAATGACATAICTFGIGELHTAWDGTMNWRGACLYNAPQTDLALCTFQCETGTILLGYVMAVIAFYGDCNGPYPTAYWTLGVSLIQGESEVVLWNGFKYSGDSPRGTYTKDPGIYGGCVVLASLTVT